MSIKFYNNTTEFLDDEIIEETNVLFEDEQDQIKEDTSSKDTLPDDTSPEDIDIVTDDLTIKEEDIEFIEEQPKFIKEITITKSLQNEFIQYTDDQFKNNVLLLCKDLCTKNNKINSINNLLKIYKKINNKKVSKLNDKYLVPIIEVKKKFYLYEENVKDENVIDAISINKNKFIIKNDIQTYFNQRNNIKQSSTTKLDSKENKLHELERPFDYLNENDSKRVKYTPEYDRDAITSCIFQDLNDYNQ